jgi:adenylylsulfate kinase
VIIEKMNKFDGHANSNIIWHDGNVEPIDRRKLFLSEPVTIWFSGLSASGKSTLAFALERQLINSGVASYVLDGDNVRHGLNYNLGFSMEDRKENVRRVAEVAKLMNDAGLVVITSFISPLKTDREIAKLIIGENKFREIYVSTPLEVCESRDPKGLYLKAREGLVTEFTGISSPYEAPENPWLSIDTSLIKVDEAIAELMSVIPF